MPFDHGKLTEDQRSMRFPTVKTPSKKFGHNSAAGDGPGHFYSKPRSLIGLSHVRRG